jgi:hypothetical protein
MCVTRFYITSHAYNECNRTSSIIPQLRDTTARAETVSDPKAAIQVLLERVEKDVRSILQIARTYHNNPEFDRYLTEQLKKTWDLVGHPLIGTLQRVEGGANPFSPTVESDSQCAYQNANIQPQHKITAKFPTGLSGPFDAMREVLGRLREESRLELQVLSLSKYMASAVPVSSYKLQ